MRRRIERLPVSIHILGLWPRRAIGEREPGSHAAAFSDGLLTRKGHQGANYGHPKRRIHEDRGNAVVADSLRPRPDALEAPAKRLRIEDALKELEALRVDAN